MVTILVVVAILVAIGWAVHDGQAWLERYDAVRHAND